VTAARAALLLVVNPKSIRDDVDRGDFILSPALKEMQRRVPDAV